MPWRKTDKLLPVKDGEHTTYIEEGSEIDGKFTFTGTVVMNGRLRRGRIVRGAVPDDERQALRRARLQSATSRS